MYDHTSLTVTWEALMDTGCLPILGYKFQIYVASAWMDAPSQSVIGASTVGTVSSLVSGYPVKLRLVARNSLGYGNPSDSIELVPSSRPSAPGPVQVTNYGGDYLDLEWAAPLDTGANDATTLPLLKYMLEVDEQFGQGFVSLFEFDADVEGPFPSVMIYTHSNLILGHPYRYRVMAQNLMGYGTYSSIAQSYIPRQVPGKPPRAPVLVPELSDRTELVIQYDGITENTGGAAILKCSVYVDDGLDG